jgi:hypothetical protein
MIKTPTGEINPDGSERFHYELTAEDMDAGRTVAFITGPIAGTMSMPDGEAYDVTDNIIAVKPEHVGHLHVAIHKAHHAAGNLLDVDVPDVDDVSLKQ